MVTDKNMDIWTDTQQDGHRWTDGRTARRTSPLIELQGSMFFSCSIPLLG